MSTMTATRPDRRALVGFAWRAALVVLAAIAVLLELPAWARAPLSIAAALVPAALLVRRSRDRGALHAVLLSLGGAVVAPVLLGLALNLLPTGLTAGNWAIGVGVLEIAVLAVLTLRRPATAPTRLGRRGRPLATIGWAALIAGVLAAALLWSVASFGTTHVAPLALAAKPAQGAVVVTASSGRTEGPFELDLVTASGRTVLARSIRIGPDASSSTTVRLPAGSRGLVQLVQPGSATPVRELILDTTSTKATR